VDDLEDKNFTIYPNPSNGSIKINFSDSTEKHTVQIFSILGQKVFEKKYTNSAHAAIEDLPIGVYLVKVTEKSKSLSKKLIVN
jgi:hypothetical protein